MLNHQDYEDKLAASYPGWKTFEDVKRRERLWTITN